MRKLMQALAVQVSSGAIRGLLPSMASFRSQADKMAFALPSGPATGRIRFGACVLDDGRGTLASPDGAETVLRPKTLELIRLLLRNPGRVVGRQEILDAVWPGLFVTDDSITQCVVELRRAMGAGGAELLKTVPRRGYLLEAEVESEAPPKPTRPALPEDRPSIAVLPFRKEGGDAQEAYFADGIIEGIVHVLSGLERIVVVSRGSALAVAEQTVDPREVGTRLGVRYVLYGGVRRAGDRLRITTELSETEGGTIIRVDRHDGEAGDIFALQDQIAERVVAAVAPQVREHELARALRKPPANLTAYDLVLRALDRMHRLDRNNFEQARELLKEAAAVDPSHGLAQSYLAWWYSLRIAQGWSPDSAADAEAADRAASVALEHDRNDGFALGLRGVMLGYTRRDFVSGCKLLDQAVAIAPSCALAWSWGALMRCWRGGGPEAVVWARRGFQLAPLDPFTFLHEYILAQAHYVADEFEQAISWARSSAARQPLHAPTWRTLIVSLVATGRVAETREALAQLARLDPTFGLRSFAERTPFLGSTRDVFVDRLRQAGLPEHPPVTVN